jgi:hypothetical protein
MSLTRTALRLCAVRALRGATWCGDAVHDSQQAAIEDADPNAPAPYLVVYTDTFTSSPGSRGLYAGGEQELIIEITLTPRMEVQHQVVGEDADGNPVTEPRDVWLDVLTDPAMEATVEAIERQVRAALMAPGNDWAALFQSFVNGVPSYTSHRGASQREGLRFVGRQLVLKCDTAVEPAPGDQLAMSSGVRWGMFLAALRGTADPKLIQLAGIMEAELRGDPTWTPTAQTRANWGLTAAEARALLMGEA